jgi:hypothetical protein
MECSSMSIYLTNRLPTAFNDELIITTREKNSNIRPLGYAAVISSMKIVLYEGYSLDPASIN